MKRLTFGELAEYVARREGKEKQVDIAQISEILKIVLERMAEEFYNGDPRGLLYLMYRYKKKDKDQ